MTTASHPLNVAIAGFGTVGRSVARLLCEGQHPALRLVAVCTRRPEAARRDAPWVPPEVCWTDDIDTLLAQRAGVVVELIGGVEPARTWIAAALRAGRAVVTANKQVMAEHGPELVSLARASGSPLRFEAAVGGAVPVIRGLQDGLAGDRVTRIAGVVNGTCNFVLGRMTDEGVSLDGGRAGGAGPRLRRGRSGRGSRRPGRAGQALDPHRHRIRRLSAAGPHSGRVHP